MHWVIARFTTTNWPSRDPFFNVASFIVNHSLSCLTFRLSVLVPKAVFLLEAQSSEPIPRIKLVFRFTPTVDIIG